MLQAIDRAALADLGIFLATVRHGNMSKAVIELGVTAFAISHRLRKLEARLSVKLLNRTSRSMTPTAAGEHFAVQLNGSFQAISGKLDAPQRHRNFPVNRLRFNAPGGDREPAQNYSYLMNYDFMSDVISHIALNGYRNRKDDRKAGRSGHRQ